MFDFEKITSDIPFLRTDHVLLNKKSEFTQTSKHTDTSLFTKKHSELKQSVKRIPNTFYVLKSFIAFHSSRFTLSSSRPSVTLPNEN